MKYNWNTKKEVKYNWSTKKEGKNMPKTCCCCYRHGDYSFIC